MKKQNQFQRKTHLTNRNFEHFNEEGLNKQIGFSREQWPIALAKELIDNGLDASEAAGVSPQIAIDVQQDSFTVTNNDSFIPDKTIKKAFNYMVGVSDKTYYVSPTRGQQGNGLK